MNIFKKSKFILVCAATLFTLNADAFVRTVPAQMCSTAYGKTSEDLVANTRVGAIQCPFISDDSLLGYNVQTVLFDVKRSSAASVKFKACRQSSTGSSIVCGNTTTLPSGIGTSNVRIDGGFKTLSGTATPFDYYHAYFYWTQPGAGQGRTGDYVTVIGMAGDSF